MSDSGAAGLKRLEELAGQLASAAERTFLASSQRPAGDVAQGSGAGGGAAAGLAAAVLGTSPGISTRGETETGQSKALTTTAGLLANLNPIVAGLMKLFGGGSDSQAQALARIERPAPLKYQGAVSEQTGWSVSEVDYWADGRPRMVERQAPAPVVVQVQAMDSRSFLDHRDEIASAVRQALLESHGLGDVMREV